MDYASRIYAKAYADGMPALLASFIVYQAAHETANFSSNVFLSCNNINGYKWIGQSTAAGPCLRSPEGDYYAKYNSIEDSVHEQTLWIRRRQAEGKFPANLNDITSIEQYAQLLKNCDWYGDTVAHYTAGLYTWMNYLGNYFMTAAGAAAGGSVLLAIIVLGYLAYRKKHF